VFVIGYLGDWQRPAKVLFESESVRRDTAPSREARQETAKRLTAGVGKRYDFETETLPIGFGAQMSNPQTDMDLMQTLNAKNPMAVAFAEVGATLKGGSGERGYPDPSDGNGHNIVAQPIPIDTMNHIGRGDNHSFGDFEPGAPSYTLTKGHSHAVAQPVAIGLDEEQNACVEGFGTLKARMEGGGFEGSVMTPAMQVRRLTPTECERLQGFQDGYTNIPWRKKPESPDGPRYKALGNSMAVPVMRWIGERINKVDSE
jgi:DNA (cytosine-5)-methyltransferase 1